MFLLGEVSAHKAHHDLGSNKAESSKSGAGKNFICLVLLVNLQNYRRTTKLGEHKKLKRIHVESNSLSSDFNLFLNCFPLNKLFHSDMLTQQLYQECKHDNKGF